MKSIENIFDTKTILTVALKGFSQSMNFPEHESQYITIRYITSNFNF